MTVGHYCLANTFQSVVKTSPFKSGQIIEIAISTRLDDEQVTEAFAQYLTGSMLNGDK